MLECIVVVCRVLWAIDPELGNMMSAPQEKRIVPKQVITSLAQDSELSVDEVVKLYEHERDELAAVAQVTTFLHIFALRNVQEMLRKRSSANKQRH
jgi:hypothetical protein